MGDELIPEGFCPIDLGTLLGSSVPKLMSCQHVPRQQRKILGHNWGKYPPCTNLSNPFCNRHLAVIWSNDDVFSLRPFRHRRLSIVADVTLRCLGGNTWLSALATATTVLNSAPCRKDRSHGSPPACRATVGLAVGLALGWNGSSIPGNSISPFRESKALRA